MSNRILCNGCFTCWGVSAYQNWLVCLDGMDTLFLERIKFEFILFGIIVSVVLLSYVIFGVEYLMQTSFLSSFHEDFNILRLWFFQQFVISTLNILLDIQFLLQDSHMIDLLFLLISLFLNGISSLLLLILIGQMNPLTNVLVSWLLLWRIRTLWSIEDSKWIVLHF